MKEIDRKIYEDLYEKDFLYSKIRAYICEQDKEVIWNELKANHDKLLNEVKTQNKNLPMPEHL